MKRFEVRGVLRSWVVEVWTGLSEERRNSIIRSTETVANYVANALLLSIPVAILSGMHYFLLVVCFSIFLPFFEKYYVWLRRDWVEENKN